jgi:hypothetical protein
LGPPQLKRAGELQLVETSAKPLNDNAAWFMPGSL